MKRNLILAGLGISFLFMTGSLLLGETNFFRNGGFEESDIRLVQDMQELIKLGWDFNQGDAPFIEMPSYWNPNPGGGSGKMQLIKEKELAYEGTNCLLVEGGPFFHIYQESNPPVAKYKYSFAAKGKGRVRITLYLYGSTPEGKVTHLGMPNSLIHEIDSDKWEVYEGTFEITKPGVERAAPALIIGGGKVYLDAIKLTKAE